VELQLYGVGAVYASLVLLVTLYNFERAPTRHTKRRDKVFNGVTLFALGAVVDGIGKGRVFEQYLDTPPHLGETVGILLMLLGTALFASFAWNIYRGLKKRRPSPSDVHLAADAAGWTLPGLAFAGGVTAYSGGAGTNEPLLMATLLLLHVATLALFALILSLMFRIAQLSELRRVNGRTAVFTGGIALTAHTFLTFGISVPWAKAVYVASLLIGATLWAAFTFDVAEGKV